MLFELPKTQEKPTPQQKTGSRIKLKKGQTVTDLIIQARKIVEEKLGKYKDASKCVLNKEDLLNFFKELPDDAIIGLDTETTGCYI